VIFQFKNLSNATLHQEFFYFISQNWDKMDAVQFGREIVNITTKIWGDSIEAVDFITGESSSIQDDFYYAICWDRTDNKYRIENKLEKESAFPETFVPTDFKHVFYNVQKNIVMVELLLTYKEKISPSNKPGKIVFKFSDKKSLLRKDFENMSEIRKAMQFGFEVKRFYKSIYKFEAKYIPLH